VPQNSLTDIHERQFLFLFFTFTCYTICSPDKPVASDSHFKWSNLTDLSIFSIDDDDGDDNDNNDGGGGESDDNDNDNGTIICTKFPYIYSCSVVIKFNSTSCEALIPLLKNYM
jgi:hypothetical protein